MKCLIPFKRLFEPFKVISIIPLFIYTLFLTTNVFGAPLSRSQSSSSPSSYNIVSSNLCDDGVKQYSGYIDINPSNHMFFWFFEARNNPETAPLTLWLTGGPGCSSLNGLFVELGPCKTQNNGTSTVTNVDSWNDVSNIIFLDEPIGVGFSYSDGEYNVTSTEQAAADMYTFLHLFFKKFPQYSNSEFHIFGESYGGRFVISLAKYIIDMNETGKEKINLKSVGIGNAFINSLIQWKSLETFAANNSYVTVNDTIINQMHNAWPTCEQATIKCNQEKVLADCQNAQMVCDGTTTSYAGYFFNAGLNFYDVREPIESMNNVLSPDYVNYLTKPDVLQAIGASDKTKYLLCSEKALMNLAAEEAIDFSSTLEFLLQNGVKTLIYHGDADWICNWKGGLDMALNLDWEYKSEFSSAPMKEWFVDGISAGQIKCANVLTFVTIYKAGHESPSDQPKSALNMFSKWLSNQNL
ncbi:prepro-carboxypeptidase Z [Gigaspora margarita]|uniref:Carboxypeptidase n=1 Tax=Gigaspora margarita TaxID=4874 RepID=A0A8H3X005_GIGMA|nr:prepro-carboxypeptidase Z [Gigaspora margarita]